MITAIQFRNRFLGWSTGLLTPVFMGVTTLAIIPLYYKMFQIGILWYWLWGIIGLAILFIIFRNKLERFSERIIPKFMQTKEFLDGWLSGVLLALVMMGYYFLKNGGTVAGLIGLDQIKF